MIHSMTGYGKAIAELPDKKITVEIRSLNSKQFDLYTRIPNVYREKEISLRNVLSKILERGRVDLYINVEESEQNATVKIDEGRLKNYQVEIKKLAATLDIEEPVDWFDILFKLPDAFKQEPEKLEEDEWLAVEKAIDEAVSSLISFRHQEGIALKQTMLINLSKIKELTLELEKFEANRIEKVKSRIIEALNSLENVTYDDNRLEQELIYHIEKLDVNEEKTRLLNHLDYFLETIESDTSQGKKLGFIVQEIGREINTLGSKSNDSDMQRIVVQMKNELEQIKEQILNVL
ncbi:MAG: YicC family protein [Bacteroidales bacterium]|nr:YicC family protein [Bacteroidales bacterium]